MSDSTNYFAQSIDSFAPQSVTSETTDPEGLKEITYDMVFNLKCDVETEDRAPSQERDSVDMTRRSTINEKLNIQKKDKEKLGHSPHLMIIFEDGDWNSATHFLIDSIKKPFQSNSITTVFVEQNIRVELLERIRPELHSTKRESSGILRHNYLSALKVVNEIQMEAFSKTNVNDDQSSATPVLLTECTDKDSGTQSTGVIMLHTFKKNINIINICAKESTPFGAVSIWNEGMDLCFDILAAINSSHFFINCTNVDLSPIDKYYRAEQNYTLIENGYHYETLNIYGKYKTIVFPVVDHIAPKPAAKVEAEEPSPISFLES